MQAGMRTVSKWGFVCKHGSVGETASASKLSGLPTGKAKQIKTDKIVHKQRNSSVFRRGTPLPATHVSPLAKILDVLTSWRWVQSKQKRADRLNKQWKLPEEGCTRQFLFCPTKCRCKRSDPGNYSVEITEYWSRKSPSVSMATPMNWEDWKQYLSVNRTKEMNCVKMTVGDLSRRCEMWVIVSYCTFQEQRDVQSCCHHGWDFQVVLHVRSEGCSSSDGRFQVCEAVQRLQSARQKSHLDRRRHHIFQSESKNRVSKTRGACPVVQTSQGCTCLINFLQTRWMQFEENENRSAGNFLVCFSLTNICLTTSNTSSAHLRSPSWQHAETHQVFLSVDRRKITYKQFREALKMLAEKKFPGDEEALSKLEKIITEAKGPVASGVTVRNVPFPPVF